MAAANYSGFVLEHGGCTGLQWPHRAQGDPGGPKAANEPKVAPAQGVFQPSQEDYDWALSILEAVANSHSAVKLDGAMIDMPVIKRAERIKQDFESLA